VIVKTAAQLDALARPGQAEVARLGIGLVHRYERSFAH